MKKLQILILIFSVCLLLFSETEADLASESASILAIKVNSTPVFQNSEKLGLVLNSRSSFGSEQCFRNILLNPGFEGVIDRTLVIVDKQSDKSITDRGGSDYEKGMWNGA